MKDLSNSIPKDGRSLSELIESRALDPGQWRVREAGGRIVLEPIAEPGAIAPGHYTPETLPPLSEGARAILASVDAAAAKHAPEGAADGEEGFTLDDGGGFTLDDEGKPGVALTDDGRPGIDPGP